MAAATEGARVADPDLEGALSAAQSALVADAVSQELRAKARSPGGACANCGSKLAGPHCHVCGQLADNLHRPVWSLVAEAFEGLFSLDGRFLTTVPALMFRPGRVSATYLKGARARYMTPFRLYLVSAVAFLLAVSIVAGDWTQIDFENRDRSQDVADAQRALAEQADDARASGDETRAVVLDQVREGLAEARGAEDAVPGAVALGDDVRRTERRRTLKCEIRGDLLPEEPDAACAAVDAVADADGSADGPFDVDVPRGELDDGVVHFGSEYLSWPLWLRRTIVHQSEVVIDDPRRFLEATNRWISRVLISLFPVYALLLAGMNFWKRRLYLYDHVVVSLHFHAFLFLLLTILIAASAVLPIWLLCIVFFVWSNLYVYKAHRLVYGSGRFSSVLRTLVLDFLYLIILAFVPLVLMIGGFLTA